MQTLFEAYAKLEKGDGMVDNHVIMIDHVEVVYNSDGSINPETSYIYYLDMNFNGESNNKVHNGVYYCTTAGYDLAKTAQATKMSFAKAAVSGSHSYIPFTLEVFQNPSIAITAEKNNAEITWENTTITGGNMTIAELKAATIDANSAIAYVTAEILNTDGTVKETVHLYTCMPSGWANRPFDIDFNRDKIGGTATGTPNFHRGFDYFFDTLSANIGSQVKISVKIGTGQDLDVATITLTN